MCMTMELICASNLSQYNNIREAVVWEVLKSSLNNLAVVGEVLKSILNNLHNTVSSTVTILLCFLAHATLK